MNTIAEQLADALRYLSEHPIYGQDRANEALAAYDAQRAAGVGGYADEYCLRPFTEGEDWLNYHDDERVDKFAVEKFAQAMKDKMTAKRLEGYSGWNNECSVELLATLLLEHVPKGDPVDIANFAMMLYHRNGSDALKAAAPPPPQSDAPAADANPPKYFAYDQRNIAVALDGDWAGWVFVRHLDGVNWTSAAKLTDMTFRMVLAQHAKDEAAIAIKDCRG